MGKNFDTLDTKIDEARKEAKADNEKLRQEFTTEIGSLRPHVNIVFARIDERR